MEQLLTELRQQVEREYRERTPKSWALHQQAQGYLPGGDTRTGTVFAPYPTYIRHAEGNYLYDADENVILDFTNNATSLIHGHAHSKIVQAIQKQAARGTAWAAPHSHQIRLAQLLCERIPSLERIRFCNSGTEANMQATKAARAFKKRDKIVMMDGAYHGSYEGTEFASNDHFDSYADTPDQLVATVRGIPSNEAMNVLVANFNDKSSVEHLIAQHESEIAALLVTPVMTRNGLTLPSEGYLAFLRALTQAHDVLLIFDEVICLRVSAGGAQEYYGVTPDLTALGKIIGGGLPVGAFGGRADIMDLFAPGNPTAISHAGTFNGNPVTMAAGIAAMELLTPGVYQQLADTGRLLRDGVQSVASELDLNVSVDQIASLVSFDFWRKAVTDSRTRSTRSEIGRLIHLALLNQGIKTAGLFAISTVTNEKEINQLVTALHIVLREFQPLIEKATDD